MQVHANFQYVLADKYLPCARHLAKQNNRAVRMADKGPYFAEITDQSKYST